jgi:mannobiose 2-epimerase
MSAIKIPTQHISTRSLLQFKKEVTEELMSILSYWVNHAIDELNGGFYGKIDNNNAADATVPKGSVLNARILWTFSFAYNFCSDKNYLPVATRAYKYITNHFIDKEYGGVFWTVDAEGNMLDAKKQVYALAFCIYGMSEYYAATNNREALDAALQLYNEVETHSYDPVNKGYLEAFARDWTGLDDLRLSAKDANEKKP